MSVLFFWTGDNYVQDMRSSGKTYDLNQNSRHMFALRTGEHVWAFTRRKDKEYVLAADLVVIRVAQNQPKDPGYKYGKYRAEGDKQKSRYFDIEKGVDAEGLIRSLSFSTQAKILGQSFQGPNGGVRPLTSADEQKLTAFSKLLPTI